MHLHNLPKIKTKSRKRRGRGSGSGKGKTAGRGMKGQKARSKIRPGFEGGQLPLIKRLPFVRGRGFRGPQRNPFILNVQDLNRLRFGSKVTIELLEKKGLVPPKPSFGVKLLGRGELRKKLIVEGLEISRGAQEKIEGVGGRIIRIREKHS